MYFWDLLRSFGLQKTMDFPMKNMDFVRENDRKPWISPWKTRILSSTFPWVPHQAAAGPRRCPPEGIWFGKRPRIWPSSRRRSGGKSSETRYISYEIFKNVFFFRKIMLKWIMENPIEMIIKQCFFFKYIYIWYVYVYIYIYELIMFPIVVGKCWQT